MREVILFYNGLDVPTLQILDSRGVVPTKTVADAKTAIQEMVEYSQKWHNGTSRGRSTKNSDGLVAIQAQLNNLGREIKKVNEKVYAAQVRCEQCKGPHYTKDCPQKEEGKTLEEAYYTTLLYKSRQMTVPFPSRLDNHCCEDEEGNYGPKFAKAYGASHIKDMIRRKEKDPGSFTLPCFINNVCFDNALVDLGASVSVMPLSTYLNLGLDELAHTRLIVELADRTVEGRWEFRTRNEDLDTGIDDYPSYCDENKKILIDCAHNFKFSCMIGFEFTHINFFPLLYVNMMSKKIHNSIIKDKMVYKGDNVVGALMNAPIFVGTFYVMTDFAVLEDMDAYRDKGMGDVIFVEPFLLKLELKQNGSKG
ncbi:reverse transcriptase domain-containing protein [Tanacetum coccineum]